MSDPLFFENYRNKIRSNEAPVNTVSQTSLVKKQEDFFKRAVSYSAILHGSFLFLTIAVPLVMSVLGIKDSYQDKFLSKEFKNAIRVDMVGLPTLTMEELQKVDPTVDMGKEDKPKEETLEPEVSETAMKLAEEKAAEEEKTAIAKKDAIAKEKKEAVEKEKNRLDDLRAQLRLEQRRKRLVEELKGDVKEGEGRTPLAGNMISEGYSVTGDVATDMDVYQGHLKSHLRKTWNLPGWMEASSLSARVLVKLAPNGKILAQEFLRESGNSEFDRYVAEALKNAEPFPKPPPSLRRKVMEDGIEWGFPQ